MTRGHNWQFRFYFAADPSIRKLFFRARYQSIRIAGAGAGEVERGVGGGDGEKAGAEVAARAVEVEEKRCRSPSERR